MEMEITLQNLRFEYPKRVRARIRVDAKTEWSGNVEVEVFVDYADSVDAMKVAAITAAKDLLARAVSGMDNPANVLTGPFPIS
jgi:nicotinate-nucleotide pyrophosphorylase